MEEEVREMKVRTWKQTQDNCQTGAGLTWW